MFAQLYKSTQNLNSELLTVVSTPAENMLRWSDDHLNSCKKSGVNDEFYISGTWQYIVLLLCKQVTNRIPSTTTSSLRTLIARKSKHHKSDLHLASIHRRPSTPPQQSQDNPPTTLHLPQKTGFQTKHGFGTRNKYNSRRSSPPRSIQRTHPTSS